MIAPTPLRSAARRLCIAAVFVLLAPAQAREKTGGKWETGERADRAMQFLTRMKAEVEGRVARITAEGAKAPAVELPFLDSSTAGDEKTAAEWSTFIEGRMGEVPTTRWIARGLKELEVARKTLAAAEKPAAAEWNKKYPGGRKDVPLPAEVQAFIYEMDVQARNLGVILDNSPSMRPSLPAVREEISSRFAAARFVEVNGCHLETSNKHWGPYAEWYYVTMLEERNPFDSKWFLPQIPQTDIHYHMHAWQHGVLGAFRSMIELMDVDAVYWFCDFDDQVEPHGIRELESLLTKNKVKLYVHTVKSNPPPALASVIKKSGGKLTKAQPEVKPVTPEDLAKLEVKPITPENVQTGLNKLARFSGTVASFTEVKDMEAIYLHPAESGLLIEIPDRFLSFPAGSDRAAALRIIFAPGRRFEVAGRITARDRSVPRIRLEAKDWLTWTDVPPAAAKPAPAVTPGESGTVPRPGTRFYRDGHRVIPPTDELIAECVKEKQKVHVNATVKSVERMEKLNHVILRFEDTALYAICQAEKVAAVFPGVDPLKSILPGDEVRLRGLIALFRGVPQVILATPDQFLDTKKDRLVPGEPGKHEVEQTVEVEIPAAPPGGKPPPAPAPPAKE